jgi:ATPase complex subunit ATP10
VVDSWFLSLRPIKNVLLRLMQRPELPEGELLLKRRVVYAFGDTYFFRKELGIPNVLAG